ncbi:hypothetical protein CEXT_33331 [Caerostris extrusa]|uniref:Uncharacterized protein n=1 Tax=Caerostris extrusa TaxID=172846 RepID=A0AAV4T752_CAEEX|nr:hypothetical protein CEXT_33331 [Caerostris extrusa]
MATPAITDCHNYPPERVNAQLPVNSPTSSFRSRTLSVRVAHGRTNSSKTNWCPSPPPSPPFEHHYRPVRKSVSNPWRLFAHSASEMLITRFPIPSRHNLQTRHLGDGCWFVVMAGAGVAGAEGVLRGVDGDSGDQWCTEAPGVSFWIKTWIKLDDLLALVELASSFCYERYRFGRFL